MIQDLRGRFFAIENIHGFEYKPNHFPIPSSIRKSLDLGNNGITARIQGKLPTTFCCDLDTKENPNYFLPLLDLLQISVSNTCEFHPGNAGQIC
jgi:hypothetical protein